MSYSKFDCDGRPNFRPRVTCLPIPFTGTVLWAYRRKLLRVKFDLWPWTLTHIHTWPSEIILYNGDMCDTSVEKQPLWDSEIQQKIPFLLILPSTLAFDRRQFQTMDHLQALTFIDTGIRKGSQMWGSLWPWPQNEHKCDINIFDKVLYTNASDIFEIFINMAILDYEIQQE